MDPSEELAGLAGLALADALAKAPVARTGLVGSAGYPAPGHLANLGNLENGTRRLGPDQRHS